MLLTTTTAFMKICIAGLLLAGFYSTAIAGLEVSDPCRLRDDELPPPYPPLPVFVCGFDKHSNIAAERDMHECVADCRSRYDTHGARGDCRNDWAADQEFTHNCCDCKRCVAACRKHFELPEDWMPLAALVAAPSETPKERECATWTLSWE